jgi:hypothetical protein
MSHPPPYLDEIRLPNSQLPAEAIRVVEEFQQYAQHSAATASTSSSVGVLPVFRHRACERCHRAKVACDGCKPCVRCKRLSRAVDCRPHQPIRRAAVPAASPHAQRHALNAYINSAAAMVNAAPVMAAALPHVGNATVATAADLASTNATTNTMKWQRGGAHATTTASIHADMHSFNFAAASSSGTVAAGGYAASLWVSPEPVVADSAAVGLPQFTTPYLYSPVAGGGWDAHSAAEGLHSHGDSYGARHASPTSSRLQQHIATPPAGSLSPQLFSPMQMQRSHSAEPVVDAGWVEEALVHLSEPAFEVHNSTFTSSSNIGGPTVLQSSQSAAAINSRDQDVAPASSSAAAAAAIPSPCIRISPLPPPSSSPVEKALVTSLSQKVFTDLDQLRVHTRLWSALDHRQSSIRRIQLISAYLSEGLTETDFRRLAPYIPVPLICSSHAHFVHNPSFQGWLRAGQPLLQESYPPARSSAHIRVVESCDDSTSTPSDADSGGDANRMNEQQQQQQQQMTIEAQRQHAHGTSSTAAIVNSPNHPHWHHHLTSPQLMPQLFEYDFGDSPLLSVEDEYIAAGLMTPMQLHQRAVQVPVATMWVRCSRKLPSDRQRCSSTLTQLHALPMQRECGPTHHAAAASAAAAAAASSFLPHDQRSLSDDELQSSTPDSNRRRVALKARRGHHSHRSRSRPASRSPSSEYDSSSSHSNSSRSRSRSRSRSPRRRDRHDRRSKKEEKNATSSLAHHRREKHSRHRRRRSRTQERERERRHASNPAEVQRRLLVAELERRNEALLRRDPPAPYDQETVTHVPPCSRVGPRFGVTSTGPALSSTTTEDDATCGCPRTLRRGMMVQCNREFERLLGWSQIDVRGFFTRLGPKGALMRSGNDGIA